MRKRIRPLISTPVLVIMIGAIFFAGKPQPIAGQENIRDQPPCSCCCSENDLTNTFNLFPANDPRTKKCWGLDRTGKGCAITLASLPEAEVQTICDKYSRLDTFPFSRSFVDCPVLQPFCKPKCQPVSPWFDSSPKSGCKDVRKPEIKVEEGTAFLRMCGWGVFAYTPTDKDPLLMQAYVAALKEHVDMRIGSRICCDKFLAAAKPGSECDPRFDLDCDGQLNPSDRTEDGNFPDISEFGVAEGAMGGGEERRIDAAPPWFRPGDAGFMPPIDLCACKWELVTSTRTCAKTQAGFHVWQSSWRCPSTGNIKNIRKEVPARLFDCTPPPPKDGGWFRP